MTIILIRIFFIIIICWNDQVVVLNPQFIKCIAIIIYRKKYAPSNNKTLNIRSSIIDMDILLNLKVGTGMFMILLPERK